MAREKTALEAKQVGESRMVRVLRRCSTNTDHNPGDIIPYAGEINPNVMRELTAEESDEITAKIAERRIELGDVVEDSSVSTSIRSEILLKALASLNPENDDDWLESGKPAISAVNRELLRMGATPDTSTRAELVSVAPTFVRPTTGPTGAASDVGPSDAIGMAAAGGGD